MRHIAANLRRRIGLALLFAVVSVASVFPALAFDPVLPGYKMEFPRDFGAHPGHRIEWWYITGRLQSPQGPMGFQVTFFRVRNKDAEANPSRFAPKQLLFAHAALADPAQGKLLHAQRSGRMLEGLVEADTGDTNVRLDDWKLERTPDGYRTVVGAEDFSLELAFAPRQPPLLQGDRGFSRKGPLPLHASYYYSEPHLQVTGRVRSRGKALEVQGTAWLDHEWSSELLAEGAAGWDWLGANLASGAAMTAFRIRARDGSTLWAAATVRGADGRATSLPMSAVEFTPRRSWRSPRTGVTYPVAMEVRVGSETWRVEPLMDDQELDARASTGTLYWEGAVDLRSGASGAGTGYLELTGYGERVPF